MAVNKVVYGDETLVDLTEDTVTAETLAKGVTAHDAAGVAIEGTAENAIEHIAVNGVEQEIVDQTVDLAVPTKASELDNDVPYVTEDELNTRFGTRVSSTEDMVAATSALEAGQLMFFCTSNSGFLTDGEYTVSGKGIMNHQDSSGNVDFFLYLAQGACLYSGRINGSGTITSLRQYRPSDEIEDLIDAVDSKTDALDGRVTTLEGRSISYDADAETLVFS